MALVAGRALVPELGDIGGFSNAELLISISGWRYQKILAQSGADRRRHESREQCGSAELVDVAQAKLNGAGGTRKEHPIVSS